VGCGIVVVEGVAAGVYELDDILEFCYQSVTQFGNDDDDA
jgi:hypothetical protein